jgi:hypothetical protein
MDEITRIRELLADPPPPSPFVVAAASRRLDRRIRNGVPLSSRLRGHRRVIAGVATVAAAVAAVAMIVSGVPAGSAHSGAAAGPLSGQPARAFLLAMAVKAESSQASGRYYCSTTVSGSREMVGPGDTLLAPPWLDGTANPSSATPAGYQYSLMARSRAMECTEPAKAGCWAGGTVGGSSQQLATEPASAADKAAWERDGSPQHVTDWLDKTVMSLKAGPVQWTGPKTGQEPWGPDTSLPTDPARLRAAILAHASELYFPGDAQHQTDQEYQNEALLFAGVTLMSDGAPPAVRAAAYQMLAGIPGIQMKPGTPDPEGRTGTAVWLDEPATSDRELGIIDPATASLLAYEDVAAAAVAGFAPGTVLDYTTFVSAGWTNQLHLLPVPAGVRAEPGPTC